MRNVTLLSASLLVSLSVMSQAASAQEPIFKKLDQKAVFSHDMGPQEQPQEKPGKSRKRETLQQRADGLSAIMVTRDGDLYEARMDPQDVEAFEQAIRELEELEGAASSPGKAPTKHASGEGPDIGTQTVIGSDGRTRITNTTSAPYNNIGRIALGCTGTLITPKHVLTAGHCIYKDGAWRSNIDFSAGQNGSSKPYGTTAWSKALVISAYQNDEDNKDYDYGLIVLADEPHGGNAAWGVYSGGTHSITGYPGDKTTGTLWTQSGSISTSGSYRLCYTIDTAGGQSGSGIFDSGHVVRGVHTTGSSSKNCGTHSITGYPGDKTTGTLWTQSGSVSTSGSYRLCYTIDTAGGQSGSGIFDSGHVVRGVHTTGSSSKNCGTRMTSTLYNQLLTWIDANP